MQRLEQPKSKQNGGTGKRLTRRHTNYKHFERSIQDLRGTLEDPFKQVINLTQKRFKKNEFKLLNKNLNFCPRPFQYNTKKLNDDLLRFFRTLKLKAHFTPKDDDDEAPREFRIKKNSTWTPTYTHPNVSTFIDIVNKDLKDTQKKQLPRDNLTRAEREALENLKHREDIIITKADKGGATVIWDVKDYTKEAYKQLNDAKFYCKLIFNPTNDYTEIVENTIRSLKASGSITNNIADQLMPENVRTPKFYLLPKIHKPLIPGRPVISSVNCHTSSISAFISYTLQPEVEKLASYVKDTTDFIKKVEDYRMPDGAFLFTMDVRALYTNIPHDEGKVSVKECLSRMHPPKFVNAILELLSLVLTMNNFEFNEEQYLQILGCAMGTICAPPYANIFMGKFEHDNIHPTFNANCPVYLRFIDDIFGIWIGSREDFIAAIEKLNQCHQTIKFDFELSENNVNFLDTNVFVSETNTLKTKVFAKPTDRQNFLHRKSEHPESLKKNIPYGQLLRGKRICSETSHFENFSNQLKSSFLKRGYNEELINTHIERTRNVPRSRTLIQSPREKNTRMTFVTTYNRTNPNIQEILLKHWHLLQIDSELEPVFKDLPMMAFRRNKNLGDMLGSKQLRNSKVIRQQRHNIIRRCKPCTEDRTKKCCKQVNDTSIFKSATTGKEFKIFHETNCQSNNIIYLMECSICNIQYVGKTQTSLEKRINGHRSDAKCKRDPITADLHFRLPGHDFNRDAKFTIIEQALNERDKSEMASFLLKIEDNWIQRLRTLYGQGLNDQLNFPTSSTGILSI